MVGCTCTMRFKWTEEHDSDCDLWYVDEFWAGFVQWSPDEEALVRTATYPAGHDDPFSVAYGTDARGPLDEEYEWQANDVLSKADEDIDKIANKFMASVLGGGTATPPTGSGAWEKREDGLWYPCDDTSAYESALSKMTTGRTPGYATSGGMDWDDDWYWANSHGHYESKLTFPDGTTVQASSIGQNNKLRTEGEPDFGLYLAESWRNEGIGMMLPWEDWGLPKVQYPLAAEAIRTAFEWAKAGALVEVGCIGAHGRTGTVLSCMAILSGVPVNEAVAYVRKEYCNNAVEGASQEWFIRWFNAYVNELPLPPRPQPVAKVTPPKAQAQSPSPQLSQTGSSRSGGATTKAQRKTRRGQRGGRRVQRSRQAARR